MYGTTIVLIFAVVGVLISGAVSSYGEVPLTFGIVLLILWAISSFTPYLHMDAISQLLISFGTAFFIGALKYSIARESNFVESWGYAIAMFMFGLVFLLGVI